MAARKSPPAKAPARKPAPAKPAAASSPNRSGRDGGAPDATPWLEWTAAALGAALILFVILVIGVEAARGRTGPAVISVRSAGVTETANGYVVDVVALNVGRQTAAEVVVEGALLGGREPEWRTVTLDYLPGGSERRAAMVFQADPRTHGLRLKATGYVEP